MFCLNCFHKSRKINSYCVHSHNLLFSGKKFLWSWRLLCAFGYRRICDLWVISTLDKNTLGSTRMNIHLHSHAYTQDHRFIFSPLLSLSLTHNHQFTNSHWTAHIHTQYSHALLCLYKYRLLFKEHCKFFLFNSFYFFTLYYFH